MNAGEARKFFVKNAKVEAELGKIYAKIADACMKGYHYIREDFMDLLKPSHDDFQAKRTAILETLRDLGYKVVRVTCDDAIRSNYSFTPYYEIRWFKEVSEIQRPPAC